jgi:hypothetical protein
MLEAGASSYRTRAMRVRDQAIEDENDRRCPIQAAEAAPVSPAAAVAGGVAALDSSR